MKVGFSHSFFTWLYFGGLGLTGNSGENIVLELALIHSDKCISQCVPCLYPLIMWLLVDRVNPQLIINPRRFSKSSLGELKIQQTSR